MSSQSFAFDSMSCAVENPLQQQQQGPSDPHNNNRHGRRTSQHRPICTTRSSRTVLVLTSLLVFLSLPARHGNTNSSLFAQAANADDYYNDDNANGNDDYETANSQYYNNQVYNGDDGSGDDYYYNNYSRGDDGYAKERESYQNNNGDDDTFHWNSNVGFEGVSIMPVSCINYNNGHMIKFQLFDSSSSYQCHFSEISTFVVSIAHYLRAYFNYRALADGKDFELPEDAAYLNCIQLDYTMYDGKALYGKIGCMERETFTSTKLQLRVYTDSQCSQPYDDGQTARKHAVKGYETEAGLISTKVTFRPPFYSCLTCTPEAISGTFNKKNGNWYDDDYISQYNQKAAADDDDNGGNNNNNGGGDDQNYQQDDAYDDGYFTNNDDVANDDGGYNNGYNGDDGGRRALVAVAPVAAAEAYSEEFWKEYDEMMMHRSLYDNYYDVGEWNMCQRIYKYGIWCDEECRSLDFFRTDQWSGSDILLLSIMSSFITAMMLLVVAKRLKAQQKARIYGDYQPMPGLPPFGMAIIFAVIMSVIISLAKLKFVNETLVFAVVTCTLLFIYMLKLTLFENRKPVLLAAPRHDMFDNPLDDHLFD